MLQDTSTGCSEGWLSHGDIQDPTRTWSWVTGSRWSPGVPDSPTSFLPPGITVGAGSFHWLNKHQPLER